MGTSADIRVEGLANAAAVVNAAFAALSQVDQHMTLWRESELTRLNAKGYGELSQDLTDVIAAALDIAAASQGAFDPTVEPLVRRAGYLPNQNLFLTKEPVNTPIDYRRIIFQQENRQIHLNGTRLDLGGVAKGYAVDKAMGIIVAAGAKSAIVNLGQSSIAIHGESAEFHIRDPLSKAGDIWARITLKDTTFSTSAMDQRPGHIINPRNGNNVHEIISSTVIAANAMEADALSTAVFVLGPDAGLRLLEKQNAQGLILAKKGEEKIAYATRRLFADKGSSLMLAPQIKLKTPVSSVTSNH